MLLKFTDRGWPILTAAWAAMWQPGSTRETQIYYYSANDNSAVLCWVLTLPHGQTEFERFIRANTDDNGICDITSLQRPS